MDIDWSPKGDFLSYITEYPEKEKYAIYTITPDGSKEQIVVEDTVMPIRPRWSPRGDAIYYLRKTGSTSELLKVAISSDGEAIKSASVVLRELQAGRYFTITNDGKHFSYIRELNYSNLCISRINNI